MWKKLGRIFELSENSHPLLKSHAANPAAYHIKDDLFRVFFNARNEDNKSSVSSFIFDLKNLKVKSETEVKLELAFGGPNSFYSHGISIGNIYNQDSENFMLFMGWQIPDKQHWRGDIGRIKINNDGTLNVDPKIAFMSSDDEDKVSLSYPWVMKDQGLYKMWYGSTISWTSENGEMIHVIKYAESKDGVHWVKKGLAIPYEIGEAQAFSRPTVLKLQNQYHCWYSYRSGNGTPYRIGYAVSDDGIKWKRDHKNCKIAVSEKGWDSEMICYPYVFEHLGNRYMLYNGNGFGKSGIGIAIWE